VLRREHKIRPGGGTISRFATSRTFSQTFQQTTETFTYLLAGIAAVRLVGHDHEHMLCRNGRARWGPERPSADVVQYPIPVPVEALVLCLVRRLIVVVFGVLGHGGLSKMRTGYVDQFFAACCVFFSADRGLSSEIWPARRRRPDPLWRCGMIDCGIRMRMT